MPDSDSLKIPVHIGSHNNEPTTTRTSVRGAALGVLFLTYFGEYWVFVSMTNWPKAPVWVYTISSLPVIALTYFAVMRLIRAEKLPVTAAEVQSAGDGKRPGRLFGIIFTIEFILIYSAVIILNKMEKPLLVPIAIALIVGLHFFPLAGLFHNRVYYVSGGLFIIFSITALLIEDKMAGLVMLGIASAIVLWVSAAIVLIYYTGISKRNS
jgi:hypothetical protein